MANLPFRKAALVSAVAMAGMLSAQQALSQSSASDLVMEEVVVTAQKREEGMQDVPIAITAMSETDLERRGVQNVGDLINAVPNMGGFEAPGGKGNVSFTLRGVGSGSPSNLSIDPANAMYVDGVYVGKLIGSALDVADIARVEVLRGPQGTLYGRNSTGGAINFITQKPLGEFAGKVTGTLGSEGLWGVKGTLHTGTWGTAGEGLGALYGTVGFMKRERDALYDNTNKAFDDLEDIDREGYRLALRWDLTDRFTVDYAYDHSELDELGTAQHLVGTTPLAVDPVTGAQTSRTDVIAGAFLGQIAPGLAQMNQFAPAFGLSPDLTADRYSGSSQATLDLYSNARDRGRPNRASTDINTFSTNEVDGHNLTVSWQFDDMGPLGSVEFKSITGYREMQNRNFGDLDGVDNSLNAAGVGAINDLTLGILSAMYGEELSYFGQMAADPTLIPVLTPLYNGVQQSIAAMWDDIDAFGGGFFTQDANLDYEQFSQELQMVGSTDRLDYAVGLYYFEDDGKYTSIRYPAQPISGISAPNYDNDSEAWAVYGQVTYRPAILDERLALTVGYRHTEEEKSVTYKYLTAGAQLLPGPFPGTFRTNAAYTGELAPAPGQFNQKFDEDFDNDSGNITVAFDVTDSTNVFLRWGTGYRSGGFNGELFANPFEEEKMEQWELGVKSDLIPAVLRVNGSLFQYTYDDLQISQISVDENGQTSSFIGNAGKADRWGAELEVQWLPLDDLMIALSYTHMDGDFDEYADFPGVDVSITNADKYAERAQSPDNAASAIVDWVFARTSFGEFMFHGEVFWQDESYPAALWVGYYGGNPSIDEQPVLDERTIVNLRLGLENVELGDGTLRAGLWARNAFDEEYATYGISYGILGIVTKQYGEEATFGFDLTYEF